MSIRTNPPQVRPCNRSDVDGLIQRHYLHRWPGVCTCVLGLFREDVPVGVIVFALPPRESIKRYSTTLAWELARLFIEDSEPKNSETWFIGKAIRFIREHHTEVELLISYADPSVNHRGTIYRAANWIADGRTDQKRKTPRVDYASDGKKYARKSHIPANAVIERIPRISKYRFLYWLDGSQETRRQLGK